MRDFSLSFFLSFFLKDQTFSRLLKHNLVLKEFWFKMHGFSRVFVHHSDPDFSDRYAWANSADPDQPHS